jgi:NAD-dependent deacetylase
MYRVEDLASREGFDRDPITVWRWYNERIRAHQDAQPNAGHVALAELERVLPSVTIATQNVDSLHARARSVNVLELHGHLRDARCTNCGETESLQSGMAENRIRHQCGGCFRPQVVWFGEALPARTWARAQHAASMADVILVVGTSAQVYPAAALALQNPRAFLAEVNPEGTPMSSRCDCVIRKRAAEVLPKIVDSLRT